MGGALYYVGIRNFSVRYGFSKKHANRLQLCIEELIYEMISGVGEADNFVDLDVSVEYAEDILFAEHAVAPLYNTIFCHLVQNNITGVTSTPHTNIVTETCEIDLVRPLGTEI